MELLAILMFVGIFVLVMYGFPVAFTLGGLSLVYALCYLEPASFAALPPRIMGVMGNYVLISVPLFIFMGIMLERSGLAEQLLQTMSMLFGRMPGGLAVSVVIVGAMLAASTGIVGATVVTMGMISLPVMLKKGYDPALSTGIIAASGTLGQIIPPSVVLVLLGSVLNVSVGGLFAAAVLPGLSLVALYVLYVVAVAFLRPSLAPRVDEADLQEFRDEGFGWKIIEAFLLPFALILAVLGSIFAGVATPTEAAAVGAMGAILLALKKKKANWKILHEAAIETTHLTAMVFMILLGATTFSFVFREMGGDVYLVNLIKSSDLSPMAFLLLVMLVVFIAGFFIDFIEIIFIIVPVVAPVFKELDMNLLWIGILLCINLQSSFLTPPFGFSLFYLKGVAPPEVTTRHLYVGIVPFVIIQMVILIIWLFFPHLVIPD